MSESRRSGVALRSWLLKLGLIALAIIPALMIYRQRFARRPDLKQASTDRDAQPQKPPVLPDPTEGAKLVGAKVCAGCHQEKQEALSTSGHSHTFALTSQTEIAKTLDGQSYFDPKWKLTYQYRFDRDKGLSVRIPGKFDEDFPLQYALGSGTHGMTFVGIASVKAGADSMRKLAIEHRVTVYPHSKQRLNLSPGHDDREIRQKYSEFGAPQDQQLLQQCFDCHTTTVKIDDFTVSDLKENVTCEKCHGPGSLHVAAAEHGDKKPGYLRLIPNSHTADQQLRACGKCHRYPVAGSAIYRNNVDFLRFQPVGLKQSRCYLESGERLKCSTCHDPHAGTSHDLAGYVAACLKCHEKGKAEFSPCPVSPKTDCIHCHMPAIKAVREVAFTDHWIRIRNEEDPPATKPIPLPAKSKKGK